MPVYIGEFSYTINESALKCIFLGVYWENLRGILMIRITIYEIDEELLIEKILDKG